MKLLWVSLVFPFCLNAQEADTLAVDAFIKGMKLEEQEIHDIQVKRNEFILYQMNAKSTESMQDLKGIIRDQDKEEGVSGAMPVVQAAAALPLGVTDDIVYETDENTRRMDGPSQFDSRIELRALDPTIAWQAPIIKNSASIGLVIEKEALSQITKGTFALDISKSLGSVYQLCNDVAFGSQPVAGRGTAFVYSPDTMLTAAHVIERKITDYVVVFGYRVIHPSGAVENFFDLQNVFYPKEIVTRSLEADVLEFRVDRPLNRPALAVAASKKLPEKNEVYMIGFPSGLPMKVALNAGIYDNTNPQYFYTSLDSFQGNSGSPVFDFNTHAVIGVLVSGEVDYIFNGNCYYTPSCSIPFCRGEKVIRMETVASSLER